MTDWSRLVDYIIDFFPDPSHNTQDIRDWAYDAVPAWKYMDNSTKDKVLGDWENFIFPQVKSWFRRMSSGFGARVKRFLGRLY